MVFCHLFVKMRQNKIKGKKMNKKIITLCSAITIATIFSACGGGGASTKKINNNTPKNKTTSTEKTQIVGRVMDGYIKDATVFLDLNKNLELDADEPKTKTNDLGQFTLELSKEETESIDRTHRIISLPDGIDHDTNLPFKTSLSLVPTKKMIENTVYLTPLSTFLSYSAVNALQGKISGVTVMEIEKQLNQTFDIDVSKQANFIKNNDLKYYKINNILQKAKELSGISYDEFSKLITKGITLDELLEKLDKPNEVRKLKEFYEKITQAEVETKKANINKAVLEKINDKKYDFDKISIKDLQNDEEINDKDDKKPIIKGEKEKLSGNGGFVESDFEGKIFEMHEESGDIFMGLSRLEFANGKINDSMSYSIEDGYLKLSMGTFKKIEEKDGKIWFEDTNSKKKYYFQVKDTSQDHNLVSQNGVLYSTYNKNAIVFLDKNKNLVQDSDEPSTITDENGNFTIKIEQIFIDKKKSLVAINGQNENGKTSKNIAFKTLMGEDKIILNPFSSALTGLAYAITNNMLMQDLSHSNMIPSLAKNIGIQIEDLTSDITKNPALVKKALKINSFVQALSNVYNDDKAHETHILEAYMHLFSNVLADIKPNISEFGMDKLLERFNHKNKYIQINPNFEQKYTDINTFEKLLEAIDYEIENTNNMSKIQSYIQEAKKFRPKKRNIAVSWDANMQGSHPLPKDQFSKYQWHLLDQGAVVNTNGIYTVGGHDLNVKALYEKGIVGQNAWVRVVDDGLEAEHEDLKGRLNRENSWSAEKKSNDTTPKSIEDSHGTNVAGLIAADGSNNIGLRGVAPYATLTAYKLRTPQAGSLDYTTEELKEAWLGGDKDKISIVNNSWGSLADKYIEEEKILKEGAQGSEYRNGKGRIYLIASGNGGFNQREIDEEGEILDVVDDSATSYLRGSQYAITVAAVRNENIITQYSAQGSNVLVSGYGGGIKTHTSALMATTTRTGASKTTWKEDSKKAYSFAFDGTSAATPVTSGALALVLSECPNLSYRDVKWLIAHSATKIDENYDGTTISGVKNVPPFKTAPEKDLHNGFGYVENAAGLSHSNYYGYGLINPSKMIEMCKDNFISLPKKREIEVVNVNTGLKPLNKNNQHLKEKIMVNESDINKVDKIEWVGLTVYGKFDNLQKLSMVLISPSGTKSRILTNSKSAFDEVMKLEEGFRFSSVAFVDENPKGEWTLFVQSDDKNDTGRFTKLKLEIVGYNSEERK